MRLKEVPKSVEYYKQYGVGGLRQTMMNHHKKLVAEMRQNMSDPDDPEDDKFAHLKDRTDTHNRGKAGKREDLNNLYVRSAWEANYARYLNFMIQRKIPFAKNKTLVRWEYEPTEFEFPLKRGTRFYTPDFKLIFSDGTYEWHEVKGWMTAESKTKIKRFQKYFPDEHRMWKLITGEEIRVIRNSLSQSIPNWE